MLCVRISRRNYFKGGGGGGEECKTLEKSNSFENGKTVNYRNNTS